MTFASGAAPQGNYFTTSSVQPFIPELWRSEILRYREDNLVMADHVQRINFVGQAGDTIRLPRLGRLGVNNKTAGTPVRYQSRQETEWTMTIDQYKESSIAVEDIAQLQSWANLRSEYTEEVGRAMARDIDDFLLGMRAAVVGADPTNNHVYDTSNPISYDMILTAYETLNLRNVPTEGRVLIVSPKQWSSLLNEEKFINNDYSNISNIATGQVGSILGIPVIMTTALQTNASDTFTNGDNGQAGPTPGYDDTALYYPTQVTEGDSLEPLKTNADGLDSAVMLHPSWCRMAVQKEPSVESERDIDFQMWKVVNTQVYGTKLYRTDHSVVISTQES